MQPEIFLKILEMKIVIFGAIKSMKILKRILIDAKKNMEMQLL